MEQQKLELIDIYDIVYEPWWLSTWAKVGLLVFFIGLFLSIGYVIYKKTRKKVLVPYWQRALAEVDALEKTGFADGQLFYVRLTETMKRYLQEHYIIQLVDKTDTELLEFVKTAETIPSHVYETMKELFDGVMFIKFAHQQAAQERMEEAVKKSKKLILSLQKADRE